MNETEKEVSHDYNQIQFKNSNRIKIQKFKNSKKYPDLDLLLLRPLQQKERKEEHCESCNDCNHFIIKAQSTYISKNPINEGEEEKLLTVTSQIPFHLIESSAESSHNHDHDHNHPHTSHVHFSPPSLTSRTTRYSVPFCPSRNTTLTTLTTTRTITMITITINKITRDAGSNITGTSGNGRLLDLLD